MADVVDTGDSTSGEDTKGSRRARWKDKLSRTKTKLKKKQGDHDRGFELSEDQARTPQVGQAPAFTSGDALPAHPLPGRGMALPRIDVSSSPRFPQQTNVVAPEDRLVWASPPPDRPQSPTQLHRKKPRRRNLSVNFLDSPVIIGEGGDDAEEPPSHVGRRRARSLSPMPPRPRQTDQYQHTAPPSYHPGFAPHQRQMPAEGDFQPRRLQRTPTAGFREPPPEYRDVIPTQTQHAPQLTADALKEASATTMTIRPKILTPELPPRPPPAVPTAFSPQSPPHRSPDSPQKHHLQTPTAQSNLWAQFTEAQDLV